MWYFELICKLRGKHNDVNKGLITYCKICGRTIINKEPVEKPIDKPVEPVETDSDKLVIPAQLYYPVFNTLNATQLDKGFVWNPSNSRKKGKIVIPAKYTGAVWATYFCDGWAETSKRFNKNEEGNRPRFYTETGIDNLPQSIYIRIHINDNSTAKDCWIFIPDTRKRIG